MTGVEEAAPAQPISPAAPAVPAEPCNATDPAHAAVPSGFLAGSYTPLGKSKIILEGVGGGGGVARAPPPLWWRGWLEKVPQTMFTVLDRTVSWVLFGCQLGSVGHQLESIVSQMRSSEMDLGRSVSWTLIATTSSAYFYAL